MIPVLVLVALLFSHASSLCHDEADFALASVTNKLNFKFFKETQCIRTNMAYSPLGVTVALCIMYAGSTGKTSQEIEMILGLDHVGFKDVHRIIRDYLNRLAADTSSYTFVIPTGLWMQKDHLVQETFQDFLDCYYNTTVFSVNFETESTKVLKSLNNWVREKSCMKIPIMSENEPSTNSKLFIISMSYFLGFWYREFKKDTLCPRTFFNEGNQMKAKKVKTMYIHGEFYFYCCQCYTAVKIPYESPSFAMVIFLPQKLDDVFLLEKSLSPDNFANTVKCMQRRDVEIFLPMFTAEFSRDISAVLINLGVQSLFTPDSFLSNLTPSNDVFVTNFGHRVLFEVRSEGGNLFACSECNKTARMMSTKFICDHPFVFFVIDPTTNLIIYTGRVMAF